VNQFLIFYNNNKKLFITSFSILSILLLILFYFWNQSIVVSCRLVDGIQYDVRNVKNQYPLSSYTKKKYYFRIYLMQKKVIEGDGEIYSNLTDGNINKTVEVRDNIIFWSSGPKSSFDGINFSLNRIDGHMTSQFTDKNLIPGRLDQSVYTCKEGKYQF